MTVEEKKAFLIQAAFYGVLLIAAGLFMKYLLGPLCPFIFGFLIAWLLQKPAKSIARRLHLPGRIPAFLLTVVFYSILFVAVTVAGARILSALAPVGAERALLRDTRGMGHEVVGLMVGGA